MWPVAQVYLMEVLYPAYQVTGGQGWKDMTCCRIQGIWALVDMAMGGRRMSKSLYSPACLLAALLVTIAMALPSSHRHVWWRQFCP